MGNAMDRICLLLTLTFKSFITVVLSIKSAKLSYFATQIQHVNPSFKIQATEINNETAQLFAEAGPMGISLAILDTSNCFRAVVTYSFTKRMNEPELAEELHQILQNESILQKQYTKTHLFWSFAESILVPTELFSPDTNNNMLNLIYGDANQGIIKSDFLYKYSLHNIYRIPEKTQEYFTNKFPYATQTHQYTALVNRNFKAGNHLYCIFFSNSLTLMLWKEGKLQVIQNFEYSNPEDAAYHLLNVCKNFELHPDAVSVHINGLIDEKSNLYAAIYNYFLNIEFDTLPAGFEYHDEIKDHPAHFFSHLFALASCV